VEILRGSDTLYNNWAFLNFPPMHRKTSGYAVVFKGYQPRLYTGLKVSCNPGRPFIWLGFALMTLGLMMVFYFHHKSLWIVIEECGEDGSLVVLGASSKLPLPVFQPEFMRISATLQRLLEKGES
jgi:cytochrome c biogenesis protein ResB